MVGTNIFKMFHALSIPCHKAIFFKLIMQSFQLCLIWHVDNNTEG